MAANFINLVRRQSSAGMGMSHTMTTLLTILLILVIATIFLASGLICLRQRRRARRGELLPTFNEKRVSTSSSSTHSNHRRVTVRPSQSIHIYHENRSLPDDSSRPFSPSGSLPEIRITFPEEVDDLGKRKSGRVVVVRVGDTGVGLEPVDEKLPAYQPSEGPRFQSVDLERVGGLAEKQSRPLGWN